MNTTPSSLNVPAPSYRQDSDQLVFHQPHPAIDASQRVPAGERALILGGGRSTGNAWLIGVVAGLFDAGLDVAAADLTVGTSAGSTAAAQLVGATPPELFDAVLAAAVPGVIPGADSAPAKHAGGKRSSGCDRPYGTNRKNPGGLHGHGRYETPHGCRGSGHGRSDGRPQCTLAPTRCCPATPSGMAGTINAPHGR